MKNIKSIIAAFFITLVCLNSDCNKVEETPPVTDLFIIEGRLVNSCTDNTSKKNWSFICYEDNNVNQIDVKTDSNGYFKIYSKFRGLNLTLKEDGGKTLLYKIPGMKNLNLGNIAYDFTMGLKLIYKNFNSQSANDSLLIEVGGVNPGNPYKRSFIKGSLTNEDLGVIYLKESPMYLNKDSIKGTVYLYKNNLALSNLISKKNYLVSTSCGSIQEIIFE